MRNFLSSVLLLGAATSFLGAQAPPAKNSNEGAPTNHLEIAVKYDASRANSSGNSGFWMQGGSVQAEGRLFRGLGAVADVSGQHTGNIDGSGVGLDMVTATIGPRYTWQPTRYRRYAFLGQALIGEANGFNSTFPKMSGAESRAHSLALKIGCGMNYTFSRRFAMRAFEADWLRTQLPNSADGVQNSLHLSAGIVYRF